MGGFRGDRNSFDNPDESTYKRNEEGSDHQEGKKCIAAVGVSLICSSRNRTALCVVTMNLINNLVQVSVIL